MERFEQQLFKRLQKILEQHGIDNVGASDNKKIERIGKAASPLRGITNAPTGALTSRFSRGKTAQTGRNLDMNEGLPTIGLKSPENANFYGRNQSFKAKTPSMALQVKPGMRNNLMNHNKNESWDVPKYGNLMKMNTIDNQDPMGRTE